MKKYNSNFHSSENKYNPIYPHAADNTAARHPRSTSAYVSSNLPVYHGSRIEAELPTNDSNRKIFQFFPSI